MKSTLLRILLEADERLEVGICVVLLVDELYECLPFEVSYAAYFPDGDRGLEPLKAGGVAVENAGAASAGTSCARAASRASLGYRRECSSSLGDTEGERLTGNRITEILVTLFSSLLFLRNTLLVLDDVVVDHESFAEASLLFRR